MKMVAERKSEKCLFYFLKNIFADISGDDKQGVTFKFENGNLKLDVVGNMEKWHAETEYRKTDVSTKKWTLFGFTWDRYSGQVVVSVVLLHLNIVSFIFVNQK